MVVLRRIFTRGAIAAAALAAALAATGAARAQSAPAGGGAWWRPAQTDTWQIQLQGTLDVGVPAKVYDVDLFNTPTTTLNVLKSQGKRVVCYFSAGSSEAFRPDFGRFQPSDMGNPLKGWEGERWLDVRSANVRAVMLARFDLAASKGCDAVDPDNVDGFDPGNDSGFDFTEADQLDYDRFLAAQAHARGMGVGLKNDLGQIDDLAPFYDFAVNEQCHVLKECVQYRRFSARQKAVFNIEYAERLRSPGPRRDALCRASARQKIRTLVLPLALDGSFRFACD